MGENVESQPQHVGFDDFYGFLSVSDMYTEWRDPYFFPEIVYSEERTQWVENLPFNKCFVHARAGRRDRERRGGDHPGAVAARRQVVRLLAATSSGGMARRASGPGSSTTAPAAPTSTTTRTSDFLGKSPAKHPYKDTIIELDDIVGRLVATLEATGQLEDTLIFVSSDNGPEMETWPDAAYSPFRCAKGSTWEGGQRVPGIVAWPGMIEPGRATRRPLLADGPVHRRCCASPARRTSIPDDRYIDGVDQTSFLLGDGRRSRTASTSTTGSARRSPRCASASTSS